MEPPVAKFIKGACIDFDYSQIDSVMQCKSERAGQMGKHVPILTIPCLLH